MIGNGHEAARHVDATGHPVEELSEEMSDAVREHQSSTRIADFIAYAEFKKKVGAARGT
jgi:hypothetical protein